MSKLNEIAEKKVCTNCISEQVLRSKVRVTGKKATCSYCNRVRNTFKIFELATVIDHAFDEHYVRVDDDDDGFGLLSHYGLDDEDGIPVIDAISDAAGISTLISSDVQIILQSKYRSKSAIEIGEKTRYEECSLYQRMRPSDAGMRQDWDAFEHELKHRARFFNRRGADLLSSVFNRINRLEGKEGRELVVIAGPGSIIARLYRARVFQSEDALLEALKNPEQQLGAPPPKVAATGRMNARGISVFYGADTVEGAIAEVRPPVGSNVAVGAFEIVEDVTLLDLTALSSVQHGRASIFDPGTKKRMERIVFLQSLGERMTKPVMPDDQEIEYLVTQAIADFLSTENDPCFDGIIFGSVQTPDSRNVVLFNRASTTEIPDRPEGTELSAFRWAHHGNEPDSSVLVFESVPREVNEPQPEWRNSASKIRLTSKPSLRLDRNNIAVHNISSVAYSSSRSAVLIQRTIKGDDEF